MITCVAAGLSAEVRRHDRGFTQAQPGAGGKGLIEGLNPNSLQVMIAMIEPSLAAARADDKFQSHATGRRVFNLAVDFRDEWQKVSPRHGNPIQDG